MTSTYTANNGIEKIETGDQSGTWGETTNTNFDIIDRALNGVGSITLSGTSHTLTTTDGSLTDGMFKVLSLAGSPTGTNTITISPNDQDKLYFVTNASGQSAVFSQGTGANVTIPNGGSDIIFADGAGSGAAVSSLFASTVTFGSDVLVGDDLTLNSDSAVLGFGADTDTTLTHTDGTGLTLNSTNKLTFGDVASFIQQSSDGVLRVDGEATIDLNASTAVTVSNDLKLDSDSAVLGFGADNDTTLTHTDGSGLTLNSTNKLMFGDSGTFIHQSADGVLDLVSDTEIEINATTIDINGAVDVSGNITGGGNLDVSSGTIKLDGNYPTGTENVALGDTALDSVQAGGNNNVAIGNSAGTAITTGDSNNCIGHTAGPAINTGSQNVALGNGAGNSETTGSDNVLVGHAAGFTQNGKSQNTFVGSQAGYTVNASGNTFVGYQSGYYATTPTTNAGFGYQALIGVSSTALTGNNNLAAGYQALKAVTSGQQNTGLGAGVLGSVSTAEGQTALGYRAGTAGGGGAAVTTGFYNTLLGYEAMASAADGQHQIVLGSFRATGQGNNTFTFGKSGAQVTNQFDSNANFSQSSDERLKTNIEDNDLGLDFINELKTKTYNWLPSNEVPKELTSHYDEENTKNTDVKMYGMLAQEVKAAMDKHGNPEFTGWMENSDGSQNVSREMFVIPLIKAVQELTKKVEELEAKLDG
tara:strand:+ start:10660 stop:12759 length:2100 start_codon:yes stop_codon:yes gene_type:complete